VIQAILGHGSVLTTTRYIRVSTKLLHEAPCLLDRLPT